jgi:hypothetical protein
MLNGRLSNELAAAFAQRLQNETNGDRAQTIQRAFWLALGRPATSQERSMAVSFLRDQPLKEFALALFNLNDFIYVQ